MKLFDVYFDFFRYQYLVNKAHRNSGQLAMTYAALWWILSFGIADLMILVFWVYDSENYVINTLTNLGYAIGISSVFQFLFYQIKKSEINSLIDIESEKTPETEKGIWVVTSINFGLMIIFFASLGYFKNI
ncbi:hypothetical protein [Reichenbachiella versicolor]|uniref:hypothetical protein n=1 Tax=Reichenbachiella versicolor TaxID=1821036 RepID=UPI000D6E944B|nr:hypothetical protein [Reichenbachiella versicolor]